MIAKNCGRAAIVALVMAALASGACRGDAPSSAENRPAATRPSRDRQHTNVVLISIDTLRADHLGTYGYSRAVSPNIDRLAADGRVFESAYAIYPRTGPSVASLLTGAFPLKVHDWRVPATAATLAEVLEGHGYSTTAAVDNANLSRRNGYAQGFGRFRETWEENDQEIARTRIISDTAIAEFTRLQGAGAPFFMWLHYVNPHGPYKPPPEYVAPFHGDRHFDPRVLVPTSGVKLGPDGYVEGEHRLATYLANYDGEVAFTDSEIGRVMATFGKHAAFSDTLVVITSDHGESFGEWGFYFQHGPALNQANLRVPLIFYQRGAIASARVTVPVLLIDVMPTILDWLNITVPEDAKTPLSGESLVRLTESTPESPHPYLFFASVEYWGVRSRDLQLNVRAKERAQLPLPPRQLFDLRRDPGEQNNLVAADPDSVERLQKVLERRRRAQDEFMESDAKRFENLSKEALENLRALGYLQ